MAKTLDDFLDDMGVSSEVRFSAKPWYSKAGDSIHYHWEEAEFFRDRIDDKLTLYRSMESGNAVGCQVKGITALVKKLGAFGIGLGREDGTPLAIFLFVSQATSEGDSSKQYEAYRYVLEHVGDKKVDVSEEAMSEMGA